MQTNSIVPLKIVVSNHSRVAQYLFVHTRGEFFFSICTFFHIMNCAVCSGIQGRVQSINCFFPYRMVSLVYTFPYFFRYVCLFVFLALQPIVVVFSQPGSEL